MAIDTAEKRRSAASFRRLPGVTPNASKDAEWRQQAARRYSGILAAESGPPDAPLVSKTLTINRSISISLEV